MADRNLAYHKRALSARVFRELVEGPPLHFSLRGDSWIAEPGDWIDGEGVRLLRNQARKQLGRTANVSQLTPKLGYEPDEGQMVARSKRPHQAEEIGPPQGYLSVDWDAVDWEEEAISGVVVGTLGPSIVELDRGQLLLGAGVHCPLRFVATGAVLAEIADALDVDVVFPVTNLSMPCSIPMIGDPGSPYPRLPGGSSTWEIAWRLLQADAKSELGVRPAAPMAGFIRAGAAERVKAGTYSFATAPSVWLWEKDPKAARTGANVFGASGGVPGADWMKTVASAHAAASVPYPDRPPVALYSTSTGPWGGVGVLFRLADELQKLGAHAFVLHVKEVPHQYRPQTAPKKIRGAANLAPRWQKLFGPEATLLASHWGAGPRIAEIQRANPDVVVTTILQDREDLFEQPSWQQKTSHAKVFEPFLNVGRGMAVSPWILSSLAEEFGKDISDYDVIVPGLDLPVFNPNAGRRNVEGPVRIVSMWRPQTAKRRGMPLLRKTYDELRGRFGAKVSLELFGWNDPTSEKGKAPTYAKHHGALTQAEVASLFASADIVVEPSAFQGLGLVSAEGMACGAAIASTQNRGIDAYATHEENALIVPHAELPHAVGRLVDDKDLRERLMKAGPASVAHLDWPLVGARWAIYLAELNLAQHPDGQFAKPWKAIKGRAELVLQNFSE